MPEDAEQRPDAWERVFPNPEQQALARSFVARVAELPGINQIVTMKVGQGNTEHERVFVLTEGMDGLPIAEDVERLMGVYTELCPTPDAKQLLDVTAPIPQLMFQEDRQSIRWLKDRDVTVLWEKPVAPSQ